MDSSLFKVVNPVEKQSFALTSTNLNQYDKLNLDRSKLQRHQLKLIEQELPERAKGLLLFHTTGSGKTWTSLALALNEIIKNNLVSATIHVITNKSLISNFQLDVEKFKQAHNTSLVIKYYAMNSEKIIETMEDITDNGDFVIIDEAHNFINGVVNNSKRYVGLYLHLLRLRNIRLYLLTGTPIVNSLKELLYIINILIKPKLLNRGRMVEYYVQQSLLDESELTAESLNTLIFSKEVSSIISYYNSLESEADYSDNHPIDLGDKVVNCTISHKHYTLYLNESLKHKVDSALRGRIMCNAYYEEDPSYIDVNTFDEKEITPTTSEYDPKYNPLLSNPDSVLNDNAKCVELIKNINDIPGPSIVYSQYTGKYGIDMIKAYMSRNSPNITHATISGITPSDERDIIQKKFNDKTNSNGDILKVLFISSAGAEGLDLKGITSVHIYEPYWNMSRVRQIKGRAIRYKSHLDSPYNEVQTFIYISCYNDIELADLAVYRIALNKQENIDNVIQTIKTLHLQDLYSTRRILDVHNKQPDDEFKF